MMHIAGSPWGVRAALVAVCSLRAVATMAGELLADYPNCSAPAAPPYLCSCHGKRTCQSDGSQTCCPDGTCVYSSLGQKCAGELRAEYPNCSAPAAPPYLCSCHGKGTCQSDGSQTCCPDGTCVYSSLGQKCAGKLLASYPDCSSLATLPYLCSCHGKGTCQSDGAQTCCPDGTCVYSSLGQKCAGKLLASYPDCSSPATPPYLCSCHGKGTCQSDGSQTCCPDGTCVYSSLGQKCAGKLLASYPDCSSPATPPYLCSCHGKGTCQSDGSQTCCPDGTCVYSSLGQKCAGKLLARYPDCSSPATPPYLCSCHGKGTCQSDGSQTCCPDGTCVYSSLGQKCAGELRAEYPNCSAPATPPYLCSCHGKGMCQSDGSQTCCPDGTCVYASLGQKCAGKLRASYPDCSSPATPPYLCSCHGRGTCQSDGSQTCCPDGTCVYSSLGQLCPTQMSVHV